MLPYNPTIPKSTQPGTFNATYAYTSSQSGTVVTLTPISVNYTVTGIGPLVTTDTIIEAFTVRLEKP